MIRLRHNEYDIDHCLKNRIDYRKNQSSDQVFNPFLNDFHNILRRIS